MVRALVSIGPNAPMRDLMRDLPLTEDINWALPYRPMRVSAKTGTLNFVSALAGFMTTAQGRELAFAIFCADTPRRAALTQDQSENPPGGRGYSRRARLLQWKLLRRWGELYM
jgi:D-alanyl-D-alanine carboxypeptidase/D-alanyl-D-alanine-endopeptidase (penicillin-binding protein 4)